jgi:hypothetical protein
VPAALVHHVGQARSACDKRSGPGITLKVSDALVSPVVIVAHNRVHYLAKCLMTVLRCGYKVVMCHNLEPPTPWSGLDTTKGVVCPGT